MVNYDDYYFFLIKNIFIQGSIEMLFFNVALLGKKINQICIQANSKQDVVNTMVKATHV